MTENNLDFLVIVKCYCVISSALIRPRTQNESEVILMLQVNRSPDPKK